MSIRSYSLVNAEIVPLNNLGVSAYLANDTARRIGETRIRIEEETSAHSHSPEYLRGNSSREIESGGSEEQELRPVWEAIVRRHPRPPLLSITLDSGMRGIAAGRTKLLEGDAFER